MGVVTSLKALPLHRILALAGAALLLISLFLPWTSLSVGSEWESLGEFREQSESGWQGVGFLAGMAAILYISWDAARILGRARLGRVNLDSLTFSIATVAAILGATQFFRALADRESALGITHGPGTGAYLTLISSALLMSAVVIGIIRIVSPAAPGVGGADHQQISSTPSSPPPPPPPTDTSSSPLSQSDPGF